MTFVAMPSFRLEWKGEGMCTRALQGSVHLQEEKLRSIELKFVTDVNIIGQYTEIHINSGAVVQIFIIMLHPSESAF